MSRRSTFLTTVAVVSFTLLVGACGTGDAGSASSSSTPSTNASPRPITDVTLPAPTGEPILAIGGGRLPVPVEIDLAGLETLPTTTDDIFDPWAKTTDTHTGPDLWTVLRAAGVRDGDTIHLSALDDYAVDVKLADIAAGGAIVATETNGAPIPIEEGGPIRIVFQDGNVAGRNHDNWIWSLNRIEVR